jgi:hypothetical protein
VDDEGIFCEIIDKLSKFFVVKDLGKMETFVGYKIINKKK